MNRQKTFYNLTSYTIILGIIILLIISCKSEKKEVIVDSDLLHVLKITNCDSLQADSIFKKHEKIEWPKVKPKSVIDAVLKLDSMTNDYNKHMFKICDPIEFHYGFGMALRNEWVHNGETTLNDQLTNKLKLSHFDYFSGLILGIFNMYLQDGEIQLVEKLGNYILADSMKTALVEYQDIENELNRLKRIKMNDN